MRAPLPAHRLVLLSTVALLAACAGGPLASPPTDTPASPTAAPAAPSQPTSRPASPTTDTPVPATPEPAEPLRVVTSTTVLADLVRRVGRARVDVRPLMPAGRDPHTFDPSPSDAALLSEADLLVINGLGLDEWLEDLAGEVAGDVPLIVLAEGLEGVDYLEGNGHEDGHEGDEPDDGHDHDAYNPHLWLDVSNTRLYVERLAELLAANDEAGGEDYATNAAGYDATLAELDEWIVAQLAAVPEEHRRVVSFHDAFPYYGRAYGLEIVGVVVESPGQEPSASELAQLVNEVRQAHVRAVLTEAHFSDQLARVVAEESEIAVVDELYTDSLGDPPLDSYEAVMRWNTERILEGLR